MVFVSSVTSAVWANARPSRVAPVPSVILVSAMMLPANEFPTSSDAVLGTYHHTLQALPPPVNTTFAVEPVVVSELAALKIQTSVGPPFRVSVPVSKNASEQ